MPRLKQKFVVNEKGKRVSVILDMSEYERILGDLEELESIRAYDRAKASGEEAVPFDEAVVEISPG